MITYNDKVAKIAKAGLYTAALAMVLGLRRRQDGVSAIAAASGGAATLTPGDGMQDNASIILGTTTKNQSLPAFWPSNQEIPAGSELEIDQFGRVVSYNPLIPEREPQLVRLLELQNSPGGYYGTGGEWRPGFYAGPWTGSEGNPTPDAATGAGYWRAPATGVLYNLEFMVNNPAGMPTAGSGQYMRIWESVDPDTFAGGVASTGYTIDVNGMGYVLVNPIPLSVTEGHLYTFQNFFLSTWQTGGCQLRALFLPDNPMPRPSTLAPAPSLAPGSVTLASDADMEKEIRRRQQGLKKIATARKNLLDGRRR